MQSIFYKIVECLLITFKLFCLVLEDSYKDFINVFVTELISIGFIFLHKWWKWRKYRWKTVYTPTIQRGSAMAVTHKSAMAKFRMNSFPDLFIPLITAETRRIRAFPHVPTRRAIPMMTIYMMASVVSESRRGSCLTAITLPLFKLRHFSSVFFRLLSCKKKDIDQIAMIWYLL